MIAALIFFGLVIVALIAMIIFGMRSVIFCEFQLPRIARQRDWKYESPQRELKKRDLHILWAGANELPTQELTRVEGTHRGYTFNFAVFEFPTSSYDYRGSEVLDIKTDATIEVHIPQISPEFEKWFRNNHSTGLIRVDEARLRSELDEYVRWKTFICRLDDMVDIIEDWMSDRGTRHTKQEK